MTHLADDRFLELSLGLSLTTGEDAHVATCAACSARLAEENDLSALLGASEAALPPAPDFVMQTVFRYERARTTRDALRAGVVLAMAMMVGAVMSVLGSVALAARIPHMMGNLIHAGIAAAKLANASAVLAASAPLLAAAVIMLATMTVSLSSALLLRLWRSAPVR